VRSFAVGDRVVAMIAIMGSRWGTAAQYVAVNEAWAARIPDHVSYANAAALPLTSLTVLQALDHWRRPFTTNELKGKKILIHAGAGGVGVFAIQYAKHVLGMQVACTASAAKASTLRQLGADLVIDYQLEQFENVVKDYDVVLDPMSWLYHDRSLHGSVLSRGGHYLSILSSDSAFAGHEKLPGLGAAADFLKHRFWNIVQPGSLPKYDVVAVSPNGKQLTEVMELLGNNTIKAVIDRQFGLDNAEDALAYLEQLEQGHCTGKVILKVHSE
jgi:alcohol dehydrogenase